MIILIIKTIFKKASMELMEKEKVNDNDEEVKFKSLNKYIDY